jgi:hypothetical protein
MEQYIEYRSQRHATLRLEFSPSGEFREVVDRFSEIVYPAISINRELVSFALLELVSNSIRAHREKGIADPVTVTMTAKDGFFTTTVQDAGRGFDPGLLPYDLSAPVEAIDMMSDRFSEYRDLHRGSRFGMGLYVARKTFPRFALCFVDGQGRPCPWFSGMVKGTRIELGLPLPGPGPAQEAGPGGQSGECSDLETLETLEEVDG